MSGGRRKASGRTHNRSVLCVFVFSHLYIKNFFEHVLEHVFLLVFPYRERDRNGVTRSAVFHVFHGVPVMREGRHHEVH
jgi:hypothetical protein